ncbi:MAG TPA: hypothetical protein VFE46_20070 [Pirellulales bacterium]|jgi:general secretion pathway protein D|nr:hypothetical protein [Pirellulales bacterium]
MEDRVYKLTSKLIAILLAIICLSPVCGWAGVQSALPLLLGAASLGDDGRSATAQADELLREARAAMTEGNYEIADSKISRAEALQPKYLPLHIGDTPKKARADLDRLLGEKAVGTDHSGQKPMAKSQTTGPKDPFLGHPSLMNTESLNAKPDATNSGSGNTQKSNAVNQGTANAAGKALDGTADRAAKTPSLPLPSTGGSQSPPTATQNLQPISRGMAASQPTILPAPGPSARPAGVPNSQSSPWAGNPVSKLPASNSINPANSSPPVGLQMPGAAAAPLPAGLGLAIAPNSLINSGRGSADDSNPWEIGGPTRANVIADVNNVLPPTSNTLPPVQPRLEDAAAQNQNAVKIQSDNLLLEARRLLAQNDLRNAEIKVNQAQGLGVSYSALDDSPAKVEALIVKTKKVPPNITAADSETARRLRAEVLMEQAEGLLRWHEYDEAKRLALEVQRLAINYTPFEPRPEQLLDRISTGMHTAGILELPPQASLAAAPALPMNPATMPAVSAGTINKQGAIDMAKQARAAMARGDLATAELIARQAEMLAPDTAFSVNEDRPTLVLLDIERAKRSGIAPGGGHAEGANGVIQAGTYEAVPVGGTAPTAENRYPGIQALYNPDQDPTRNLPASNSANSLDHPQTLSPIVGAAPQNGGLPPAALASGTLMASTSAAPPIAAPATPLDGVTVSSATLSRQVAAEVTRQQTLARDMREKQPKQALELLQRTREMVASVNGLDAPAKEQMLRRLDLSIHDLQQYIAANAPEIEQEEKNRQVQQDVDRTRKEKLETQEKVLALVKDFNKLLDEQRYAEAQVVAKRATELDPDDPVVVQLQVMSKMVSRVAINQQVKDSQEDGFWLTMNEVDKSAIPFSGDFQMPDAKKWHELSISPARRKQEFHRRSAKEQDIEQRLSTPVAVRFDKIPLSEVIDKLGKIAQVPTFLDPQGLQAEGVQSDTPISIDLSQDISLKSALKLILDPLRLTYIISDEVLKITTIDVKRGQVYTQTYSVGDLVIRIPNFAPTGQEGINGAFREAMARMGWGGAAGGGFGAPSPALAVNEPASNGGISSTVLSQQMSTRGIPFPMSGSGQSQSGSPQNIPFGPGGMKGGAQADFDTLIDLITSTIAPQSWSEMGGPGTIQGYDTNLSLVVSQTQEVHEQIADLLAQLRKLEDLQVTIEVRFITLDDDFFERIGVNFQFNIPTNTTVPNPVPSTITAPPSFGPVQPSAVVGLDPTGAITQFQDVQFRQGSFGSTLPPFPGTFDAGSAATFGFAILSDIQAFFVVQAAQGDNRSNVMQAPKVTLFNGQQATVSDTTQVPFVTSVIPVVGDFAAAQQPVIVVLSEGTSLTVQAVVSNDRRFVRLTVVPFFSNIGQVNTFTFTGSSSSTQKSSEAKNSTDQSTANSSENDSSSAATTVQLPQFSFVTVTTTVSVPDGGTVLLGGIKRLSEGRVEEGVPVLSKLPYINRLFRNTGIGRTTSSLMMMVTPRIIIEEEEEENLIGPPSP